MFSFIFGDYTGENNLVGGVIARSFSLHGVTLEGGGTAVIVGDFCLFVS